MRVIAVMLAGHVGILAAAPDRGGSRRVVDLQGGVRDPVTAGQELFQVSPDGVAVRAGRDQNVRGGGRLA